MQTIKNETNEKRLITMRNDLTNAEVENKKLTNTLSLLEKNMCTDDAMQLTKESRRLRSMNSSKRIMLLKLPNTKIC